MKLKLRLRNFDTFEVSAHRILKKTFPEIELYIHTALEEIDGKAKFKKGYYRVSEKNGIGISEKRFYDIRQLIDHVTEIIKHIGIENFIEKQNEILERIKNNRSDAEKIRGKAR